MLHSLVGASGPLTAAGLCSGQLPHILAAALASGTLMRPLGWAARRRPAARLHTQPPACGSSAAGNYAEDYKKAKVTVNGREGGGRP